jgi:uncharacterized DUF497 family protein
MRHQLSVQFEFDPWKSENNKAKHGIDFVEAQALWKSKIVLLPAKDALEKRYLVIGTIGLGPLVCDYHLSWRDNSDY